MVKAGDHGELCVLLWRGQALRATQVAGARGVSRGEAAGSHSPHPATRAPRRALGLQTSP